MKTRGDKQFQIVAHIVMILVTMAIIIPFLLLFMSSVTDEQELLRNGYTFFPSKLSIEAYRYIFNHAAVICRAYGMSIFVTIVGTSLNLIMSTMLAYGLSVDKLPFRKLISFYIVFTMLFNGGLVPTYIMYTSTFHIKNTIFAQLVPGGLLLSAMNVLLIRTYITTGIPDALLEAAAIDGAGHMVILKNIVLPLGKPIIVTMAMFSGLGYWNDWTNGLYYLSGVKGRSYFTIQNLLNEMLSNIQYLSSSAASSMSGSVQVPSTGVRMAIAFVAIIPILIMFPFLQKYFQKGIMLGSVKG